MNEIPKETQIAIVKQQIANEIETRYTLRLNHKAYSPLGSARGKQVTASIEGQLEDIERVLEIYRQELESLEKSQENG